MDVLKKRWIILFSGFALCLFMGVSNAWSIFVVPLETTFSWTRSQTSLAYTICIVFFSIGSILTGFLSRRFSFRTILMMAAALIGGGFFLSSKVDAVWQIYFSYSIMVGTGIGMGYNAVLTVAPNWFYDKSGLASGILMMGYALSTAVFGPVINTWISSKGISGTFTTLAIVCFIGIFLSSLLQMIPTYDEEALLPKPVKKKNKSRNMATNEMLKQPSFYLYFVFVILASGAGLSIINHMSPMLVEGLAVSSAQAAVYLSICSIFNGGARVVWGSLSDHISVDKILLCVSAFFVAGFSICTVAFSGHNEFLFVIGMCIIYVAFGGNAACCPIFVRSMYGNRTFSLNYSVVSLNSIINAFFPTVIGILQASSGSYALPLMVLVATTVLALVICIILARQIAKETKVA